VEILWTILIGFAAGWLAGQIVPGPRRYGIAGDIAVGVIGAFVGSYLLRIIGAVLSSLFTATIGAVVLLLVLKWWQKGRVR
jgi:uncharacterized membrane protein YeaQ/YmgE (transglycosylase-associated protein family)